MRRMFLAVLCLVSVLPAAGGQTAEQKKATLQYLRALQTPGGGFLPAAGEKQLPSLRATSAALRALKYFGGEPRDQDAARKFVQRCHDKDSGGFVDRPGSKPEVFTTAVGLMAIVELKVPIEAYAAGAVNYLVEHAQSFEEIRIAAAGLEALGKRPAIVETWRASIVNMRNADGTFGKKSGAARDTGGAVAALLRLGGQIEQADNVVKVLKAGQRDDGAFGPEGVDTSDLETSYRVLRSFVMLKEKPANPERLRAFVARCRNADGGYGVAPGKPSSVGGTYFASIILHWLETP